MKKILSDDTMNIPLSDIDKMINEVDADNDGQIDYNEFLEMMKKDLHVWLAVYNTSLKDLLVFKPQCSIFWGRMRGKAREKERIYINDN